MSNHKKTIWKPLIAILSLPILSFTAGQYLPYVITVISGSGVIAAVPLAIFAVSTVVALVSAIYLIRLAVSRAGDEKKIDLSREESGHTASQEPQKFVCENCTNLENQPSMSTPIPRASVPPLPPPLPQGTPPPPLPSDAVLPPAFKPVMQPIANDMLKEMQNKKLKKTGDHKQNKLPGAVDLNEALKAKFSKGDAKNETLEEYAARIDREVKENKKKNKVNTTNQKDDRADKKSNNNGSGQQQGLTKELNARSKGSNNTGQRMSEEIDKMIKKDRQSSAPCPELVAELMRRREAMEHSDSEDDESDNQITKDIIDNVSKKNNDSCDKPLGKQIPHNPEKVQRVTQLIQNAAKVVVDKESLLAEICERIKLRSVKDKDVDKSNSSSLEQNKALTGKSESNVQQADGLVEVLGKVSNMIPPPPLQSRSNSVSSSDSETSDSDWKEDESEAPPTPQSNCRKRNRTPESSNVSSDNEGRNASRETDVHASSGSQFYRERSKSPDSDYGSDNSVKSEPTSPLHSQPKAEKPPVLPKPSSFTREANSSSPKPETPPATKMDGANQTNGGVDASPALDVKQLRERFSAPG